MMKQQNFSLIGIVTIGFAINFLFTKNLDAAIACGVIILFCSWQVFGYKSTIETLEKERLEWSLKNFPQATAESSLIKARKELAETKAALFIFGDKVSPNPEKRRDGLSEEYADVLMCVFDSAGRAGFTIDDIRNAYAKKLKKNKSRIWKRNHDNTYFHIKSPAPNEYL